MLNAVHSNCGYLDMEKCFTQICLQTETSVFIHILDVNCYTYLVARTIATIDNVKAASRAKEKELYILILRQLL